MRTTTLSNGTTCHIAELSLKAAIEAIKADFRTMPFTEATERNREDIDYIISRGYAKRGRLNYTLRQVSEFAGLYNINA